MIKPILSIIILSFNTRQLTLDCLKSILKDKGLTFDLSKIDNSSKIPTEIIVVDNNSQDDSVKELKKINYIKLIENRSNAGFGKANNQAAKIAQGNYLLLLNSDTIILHSAISQSLDWLSSHPEALSCTAQLLNKDKTIQASGGYFPNFLNIFSWCFSLDDLPFFNKIIKPLHPHTPTFYTHDRYFLTDHPQDWLTGAFILIRKPNFDKVNGFDENYFMYGEEVELYYRLKLSYPQLQNWYLIGPQIIHLGGASAVSRLNPIINEYTGIISFFKKHHTQTEINLVKSLLKINAQIRRILYLIRGKKESSAIYQEACSRI